MGIFKEIYCSDCGKKAGVFTRTRFKDKKYVCCDCVSDIPSCIKECFSKKYEYDDYKAAKEYMQHSNETLKQKFEATAIYGSIQIDEENKIFCIKPGLFEDPIYLEFVNVLSFDIDFEPTKVKEGFLGDKVFGNVVVYLKMCLPCFAYIKTLKKNVKTKSSTNFLGTKITYECPEDAELFLIRFMNAWSEALEEVQEDYDEHSERMSELEKAKTLFMLDDIDDITLDDIKEQRNRLIKMFHPDSGNESDTKYAQKINTAYEIIKESLK